MTSCYKITRGAVVFIIVNDIAESIDIPAAHSHLEGDPRARQLPFGLSASHRDFLGYKPEPMGLLSMRMTTVPYGDNETANLGNIYLWPSGLITYEFSVRLEDCTVDAANKKIKEIQASRALETAAFVLSEQIVHELGQFMVNPALRKLAEDYIAVCAESLSLDGKTDLSTDEVDAFVSGNNQGFADLREQICKLLRPMSEGQRPARQEIADAWEHVYEAVLGNFAVVDFDVAFIYGRHSESILSVLLLLQVQMLTLRELNADLQNRLPLLEASAKEVIGRKKKQRFWSRLYTRVATGVVDTLTALGILTASDDNIKDLTLALHDLKHYALSSINLAANLTEHFGNVSLHRLYDSGQKCFDFQGLSSQIETRLTALNETLAELNSILEHHRSYYLEIVVIVLIAIEVIKSFMGH